MKISDKKILESFTYCLKFYDKKQNVTFLASGMGNSKADNFMRVTVRKESSDIDLIPLNNEVSLGSITDYDLYDHFLKLFKNEKDYLFFIYIKKPLTLHPTELTQQYI